MNKKKKVNLPAILFSIVIMLATFCAFHAQAFAAEDCLYLSDMECVKSMSKYGYKELISDKTLAGTDISVKVDNNVLTFKKGVFAHAPYTLVYDISEYHYDYFTAFLGVNSTAGVGDGVKFYVYTSSDGKTWDLMTDANPQVMKKDVSAQYVEIPLNGDIKYLKFYIDQLGGNGSDHSVLADAKLCTAGYLQSSSYVKTLKEYDEEIKDRLGGKTEFSGDDELLLLQRDFVSKAGYSTLQLFANENEANKEIIRWLMNDLDALRYYLLGGTPSGSYPNSLTVLSNLLKAHKDDLNDTTATFNGVTTRGDLYKRMMITLSLTHAENVRLWLYDKTEDGTKNCPVDDPNSPNVSDPVRRYEVYKKMYLAGKLSSAFEWLEVEEMRLVMNSRMSDYGIEWLRDYIFKRSGGFYGFNNSWVTYRRSSYYDSDLYDEANKDRFNTKYNDFLSYGVPYQKYYPSLWMAFEKGGICWQIANAGTNALHSYGLPSIPVSQPGHLAYMVYNPYGEGHGRWSIYNSGWPWAKTNYVGYDPIKQYYQQRPLNGWGSGSYASKQNGSYVWLAQAAINDYSNYVKSQKIVMLADSYAGDYAEQERLYREAIKVQQVNFDAWLNLVYTYIANENKTSEEYYNLATELAGIFSAHPTPLYDLMKLIEPCVTDEQWKIQYTILISNTFQRIAQSSNTDIRRIAEELMGGAVDEPIASFSFDGEHAGQIRLGSMFSEDNLPKWAYSINGGKTFTEVSGTYAQLTKGQMQSISHAIDIKVRIFGLPAASNTVTIDITNDLDIPKSLHINDFENKIMGVDTDKMEWYRRSDEIWHVAEPGNMPDWKNREYEWQEVDGVTIWRYTENDIWIPFTESQPVMTGDSTVKVRMSRSGTQVPLTFYVYDFTEDKYPDTRRYVPVANLSVVRASSEASGNPAANSIDGNIGSYDIQSTYYDSSKWLSLSNDTERFIIFKTANPMYLSSIEYIPSIEAAGRILDGKVYGSMDGENWTEIASVSNWKNDAATKTIDIADPMQLQYIKIVGTRTQGGNVISARHFNFFQNVALNENLYGNIEYSTTQPTNRDVTVRVTDVTASDVIFDSEGGDAYTFTENGTHEFKFHDPETGKKGTAVAVVNWIDKTAPVGTIEYSTTSPTNSAVTATLVLGDDAEIVNDDLNTDNVSSNPHEYIFMTNGEYTFKFKDAAGNVGTATASVDWIDTEPPTAEIDYSKTAYTNQSVTATLTNMDEGVTILNNGGSNSYTFNENGSFEFVLQDRAGNTSTIKPEVTWIHDCEKTGEHLVNRIIEETTCTSPLHYWYECKVEECDYRGYEYTSTAPVIGYHTLGEEWIIGSEPTCTEDGLKWQECTQCEYRDNITVIPKLGHTYTEEVTLPTCTSDGFTTYTCSTCTHSYVDNVIPGAHKYVVTVTAPTCIRDGFTTHACSVCGDRFVTDTVRGGHTYEQTVTAPTCVNEGYTTYKCTVCKHSYKIDAVPTVAHTAVKDAAAAPTCTQNGFTEGSHCEVCGEIITARQTVEKLGHSYTGSVTAEASCTAEGEMTYTCSRCSDHYTESIPKKDHTIVAIPAVEPTCTAHGKTEGSHCSVCDEIFVHPQDIPMKEHEYTSSVTKEPTCAEDGIETFRCIHCGSEYTHHIERPAHTPVTDPAVAPTCSAFGKTEGSHCSVCGATLVPQEDIAMTPHEFERSEITTPPTCTAVGERTYYCKHCGATRTEEVEMTEHTPETVPAIEPTCTTLGKTEGSQCAVCGKILEAQQDIEMTPHAFNRSDVTTAPTCIAEGERTYFCDHCSATKKEAVTTTDHDYDVMVWEATCLWPGQINKTCKVCGHFESIPTGTELGPHKSADGKTTIITPATCTTDGEEEFDCGFCYQRIKQTIPAAHTVVIDPAVEANCKTEGKTEGSHCSVCGDVITAQEIIPKTDHHYSLEATKDPTCTEAGFGTYICRDCGETHTDVIPATGHTVVTDEAVEATCTTDGLTQGSHCSVCNATITAQEIIPQTGHDYSVTVTKEATCTEEGVKTHTCSKCDTSYTETITRKGHTPVIDPAVASTCTTHGKTEGSHCSVCGETITAQEIIPFTGHNYVGEVTKKPTCTEKGETTYKCTNCDSEHIEAIAPIAHAAVPDEAVEPTCTEAGKTAGSHCAECKAVIEKQEEIPATGHAYVSTVTNEPTCEAEGERTSICSNCGDTKSETIAKIPHTEVITPAVESTCTMHGKTEGTHCSVCGTIIKAQEETALKAHDFAASQVTTEPTCQAAGERTYTCSHCSATKTEAIEQLAHTVVTDPAVPATCISHGKTEGSHCSVCNTVIVPQENTDLTDHDFASSAVTTEPTCNQEGIRTYMCTHCMETKTESIAKIAHTAVTDPAVEATCSKAGKTEGSHCSVCGTVIVEQKDTPLKAHDYKAAVTAPTCTAEGYTTYTCSVCGLRYIGSKVPAAHTYQAKVTAPTCTAEGYTTYTCSVCGHSYQGDTVPVIEHSYSSSVTKAATCTESGIRTFQCTVCGNTYTEDIPATGHKDNNKDKKCDVCAEPFDPSESCDCICHKDGILGFLWKILRFFCKLFKMYPVCECGAAHY